MDQPKDYPEHLNPFKTRTGGIRGSFRQLKSTLSKTFRKKDKESKRAEIRINGAGASAQSRQTVPAVLRHPDQSQINTSPALPRSRFSERVIRAQTYHPDSTQDTNPFGEIAPPRRHRQTFAPEIEGEGGTQKRHRAKKRAPLPPHRRDENGLLGVPDSHGSKWSVNSGDTDISSSNYTYYSETDLEMEHDDNLETVKELQVITKEIQNLTENDAEIVATNSKMPDLVVSTESDVSHHPDFKLKVIDTNIEVIRKDAVIDSDKEVINTNNEVINTNNEVINTNNITHSVIESTNEVIITDTKIIDTNNQVNGRETKVIHDDVNDCDNSQGNGDDNSQGNGDDNKAETRDDINIQINKTMHTTEEVINSTNITKETNVESIERSYTTEKSSPNKIIEDAINELANLNVSESGNGKLNNEEGEPLYIDEDNELDAMNQSESVDYQNNNYSVKEKIKKFQTNSETNSGTNYCQVKSLYVGGSRDALDNPLNYKERKSIYISGSCDDLIIDNNANNNDKIRKHIITTEEALLGVAKHN